MLVLLPFVLVPVGLVLFLIAISAGRLLRERSCALQEQEEHAKRYDELRRRMQASRDQRWGCEAQEVVGESASTQLQTHVFLNPWDHNEHDLAK